MKEKVCALCGKKNITSGKINVNKFITTNSVGAKEYFDLWHFRIEKCSGCHYSSRDISVCANPNIKYLQSNNHDEILKLLNEARPNDIATYMDASRYYQLVDDTKNQALCLIQAGDAVYNEILYWKEYILTEDETCEDLYVLGEELYSQGINLLKEYITLNPTDIDMQLLLIGILGDSNDKSLSFAMLKKLKSLHLDDKQRTILDFLEKEFY